MSFAATDYPAEPYPGARPGHSYVQDGDEVLPLLAERSHASGWQVAGNDDLDDWLRTRGFAGLDARLPILAYGSNACPSKISWMRTELGLPGPVVALRADCGDVSAVWATGLRDRDGQRPATLAAATGVREQHFVWLADSAQLPALDACEARGERYHLAWLRSGQVLLDGGAVLGEVLTYVAASPVRQPLLVHGGMVRCAELPQQEARRLRGVAADRNGLDVSVVDGQPQAAQWPAQVFVYGTLQPGSDAWSMVEPHLAAQPRRTEMPGELFDTGEGYPALRPPAEQASTVPGWVLPLRDPPSTLPLLDEYEGPEYRRLRLATVDGELCWTYVFIESTVGMPALREGWPTECSLG